MKSVGFLSLFLVLILLVSFVNAESGSGRDGDGSDDNSGSSSDDNSGSNSGSDDDSLRVSSDIRIGDDDSSDDSDRVRVRTETRVDEDGRTRERYEERRRVVDPETGEIKEIRIRIEKEVKDGEIRSRIKYRSEIKGEDVEVDSKVELEEKVDLEDGEEMLKIKAKLSNGDESILEFLPEHALEAARERFALDEDDSTEIEIEEVNDSDRNIPRVVYHIESEKNGRFLGIFKMKARLEASVDPETGEIIDTNVPWWISLLLDDDALPPADNNDTDQNITNPMNDTDMNLTGPNLSAVNANTGIDARNVN